MTPVTVVVDDDNTDVDKVDDHADRRNVVMIVMTRTPSCRINKVVIIIIMLQWLVGWTLIVRVAITKG